MTEAAFITVLEDRIDKMRRTLESKSAEYSHNGDNLHNFKAAGELDGVTPAVALKGMLAKHWVSIQDIVRTFDKLSAGEQIASAAIDEKIGDAINYLVLLEAILRETK